MKDLTPDSGHKSAAQLERIMARATLVADSNAIGGAMDRLAAELDQRLAGSVPLLLCVMNGGLMFAAGLMARMKTCSEFDYLQTSRYGKGTRGSRLEWRVQPEHKLQDRDLVLVDDIFDEGHTLAAIHRHCAAQSPRRLLSVVLFDKQHDRKIAGFRPDLAGLQVPDVFLVGCGMDWSGYFRHLPAVYALPAEELA